MNKFFVHESSFIDKNVHIGEGTKIWHFSHILQDVTIGKNCVIGQNVMIGPDVNIGNNCKIQNNVSLYKGLIIGDNVFFGPSCVFTNVKNPRASVEKKDQFLETIIEDNVTIGANATIICGNKISKNAFIGAGSVVNRNVLENEMVVGNPIKFIGKVCECGEKVIDEKCLCKKESI